MLLVHGCPATHTLWNPLVPSLARHRTLYAIDLPGFGASHTPKHSSTLELRRLTTMLLAFAEKHGLERFDLVGHSFGGALAASMAAEAPERVRSLVMVSPMGCDAPPAARLARTLLVRRVVAPLWRALPGAVRRAVVRASTHVNYGPAYVPARGEQIAAELDRDDAISAICQLVAGFDYAEYRRRLERLEEQRAVPTLLLGARQDRVVPYRHFETLRSILRSAESGEFDDGVHVLMWQHPEPIAEQIIRFVDRP
jgi:pimeloyl-ACP methyl ester carboxylesterase